MGVISLVIAILGLNLLIFVHELGHFLAAKLAGIKVYEFMFGLPGPKIFSFNLGETSYGATTIPFGGYVRFAGMDPHEELSKADRARAFNTKPMWQRISIILAGPLMNLILPIMLIAIVLMVGIPTPTTAIAKILPNSPAFEIGLRSEDKIISIEGKKTPEWSEIIEIIQKHPRKRVKVEVMRGRKRMTFYPTLTTKDSRGFLGIETKLEKKRETPLSAVHRGTIATGMATVKVCQAIYDLFTKGGLLQQARGPVGIIHETTLIAKENLLFFLQVLALISIHLAVINLFPIPPLDGGRLAILGVEVVRGRPIDPYKLVVIQGILFSLLMALIIYLTMADIQRLLIYLGGL
ncbi:MAG: M50 family metallopeptidase [Actinomycetota bacterium]|nr:M50 family metallopeptidase [Actinomycetota bacterium]